jgi:ABC-type nitrate/sulfonate/bicarbonate transport system ATPase subunit
MAGEMVTVKQLNKSYGSHRVIDGLSFTLHEGERLAVFAPSGAGKTTLIKILNGLESPDSGRVEVSGANPVTIFQEPRLFPFLTVEENIYLPYKVANRSITAEVNRRYQDWMHICELEKFTKHYPYQLSGGMRQKAALVRGLLGQPRFVMMDEPFQSVNYLAKQALIAHILETLPGITILFVTHIVEEIPMLAQQVMFFTDSCLDTPQYLEAGVLQEKLSQPNPLIIINEKDKAFPLDVKKKETL